MASLWDIISGWFKPHSNPTPTPPAPTDRTLAVVILDGTKPIVNAFVTVAGVTFPRTNTDGYAAAQVPFYENVILTITADGYNPYSASVTVPRTENHDIVVGKDGVPALVVNLPPLATGEAVLHMQACFCNLRDSQGRIIYTPELPGAPEDVFKEWFSVMTAAGCTHVVVGDFEPGPIYPGAPWSNPDLWNDMGKLRAFLVDIMQQKAADGYGYRPVVFLDNGSKSPMGRINQRWPEFIAAMRDLLPHMILVIAWEPVVGDWRSIEVSQALLLLKSLAPEAIVFGHGSPTRWVASSNPIETDDPWQGGEADFFLKHGGEFLQGWMYQTQHGRDIYTPCTCPNKNQQFGHLDTCWLNRFEDGVARLGAGFHGWRVVRVVLYETVAYEAFRNQATPADAVMVATAGATVGKLWNVKLGYGNGLPKTT